MEYIKPVKEKEKNTYIKKFMTTNDINKPNICDICFGSYSYFNKSHHIKSVKHQKALEMKSKNDKITELEKLIIDMKI